MGVTKEYYFETMELTRDWEQLIARILSQPAVGEAAAIRPDEGPADEEEWQMRRLVPDIVFTPLGKIERVAVEFKMFRWHGDAAQRLGDAAAHMQEMLDDGRYSRGIIAVSIALDPREVVELSGRERIQIWDLTRLREQAATDLELLDELEDLAAVTLLDPINPSSPKIAPETQRGASIAAQLNVSTPGEEGWQHFEKGCEEAIGYLFGKDLHNLTRQQRTDDELNRMDIVGRIAMRPSTFWSMLAADFRTRYIVFEAKNSAKPIGQIELEITAKYLSRNALRTVGIIIARAGATKSAERAVGGILRENGKLLILLSLAELTSMLYQADEGEPPENILFERMDRAMMQLGR